jgi:subtilisin family serine protease
LTDGVTHMADAVASGDLPPDVQVLKPGSGDEGTAVLEILHDIAPGAALALYSPDTSAEMVAGIDALAAAGARILVDDLAFFDEPRFEDGMIARAARNFATGGRLYVTAAGNAAQQHYRSGYRRLADQGFPASRWPAVHNYEPSGVDIGNTLIIPGGCRVVVILQWNNPFGAAGDDFDLFLGSDEGILAFSLDPQDGTGDPYELVAFTNSTPDPIAAFIAVAEFAVVSPPSALVLDYVVHSIDCEASLQHVTTAESVSGHAAVSEVLSVGAVAAATPDEIQPYSSRGPASIAFPAPEARNVPSISGVDCVATRVGQLGVFSSPFCGTSAAAAHVGGVAALLMEQAPSLSSEQYRAILMGSAVDLGPVGFDFTYGAGRVDALAALRAIRPPPPRIALDLALDRHTLTAGEVVRVGVSVANPGGAAEQDVYFAVLVPAALSAQLGCPAGDAVVFATEAFASSAVVCSLTASPRSYVPLFRSATVPAMLPPTRLDDFFRVVWPAAVPGGTYTFMVLTTPPGAFADGEIGPADITAFAADRLVASP